MEMLLNIIYYVVPFIVLLGILVFVHEFGHFIVARILGAKVVVLDERGVNISSLDLAAKIEGWLLNGCSEICFLIGGADGHLEETRQKADLVLSFGKLTLPHILMRAVLAEQIYRAETIISGHPYHRV